MRQFSFAQLPEPLILDPDVTPLELRAYAYIDLRAGRRGRWDDTLGAIADVLRCSRSRLGAAMRRLADRGLVVIERLSPWRWRFLLPERIANAQLPLDEHLPETLGAGRRASEADPDRARGVAPIGSPPGPDRVSTDEYTFFRSQIPTAQRSDPSAGADRMTQRGPGGDSIEPAGPQSAQTGALGLATQRRGRGRLDGLHNRFRRRLVSRGLGYPGTAEEWRRADALVLEWAQTESRSPRPAAEATTGKPAGVRHQVWRDGRLIELGPEVPFVPGVWLGTVSTAATG